MDFEFDFGAELAEGNGVKRVNPEEGLQYGVLKSVIHLGKIGSSYQGKPKPPVNKVVLNFELKGNLVPEGEDECITGLHPETGEPLDHSITINLTKGDNAMLTKVMAALISKKEMTENTVKGWDQLIGRPVGLDIKGSDEKVDGKPKYVDIKGISAAPAALKAQIPGLKNPGVGHATLPKLTVSALHECNMYLDVQMGMMKSEEWAAGYTPCNRPGRGNPQGESEVCHSRGQGRVKLLTELQALKISQLLNRKRSALTKSFNLSTVGDNPY